MPVKNPTNEILTACIRKPQNDEVRRNYIIPLTLFIIRYGQFNENVKRLRLADANLRMMLWGVFIIAL